jgi:hypothetical protein
MIWPLERSGFRVKKDHPVRKEHLIRNEHLTANAVNAAHVVTGPRRAIVRHGVTELPRAIGYPRAKDQVEMNLVLRKIKKLERRARVQGLNRDRLASLGQCESLGRNAVIARRDRGAVGREMMNRVKITLKNLFVQNVQSDQASGITQS